MTGARGARFFLTCAAIGLLVGLFSGVFGVGGGTVMVPFLVLLLGFDQRRAAGTSLAAMIPSIAAGSVVYASHGSVDWLAAGILALGAIVGAQAGTWLLSRAPLALLRWGFVGFLAVVIVSLFIVIPSREATLNYNALTIVGLVVLGVVTGILAGLLGVGGGVLVVPALLLLFGASDLIAKGTSLLMMMPTVVSGTVGNARRRNVDLAAAITIGLPACATVVLGAWVANVIDPLTGNILFAGFLTVVAVQLVLRATRRPPAATAARG